MSVFPHVTVSRHNAFQSGFSLIEVMIAIMIMAMISLVSWRGLDSMTRTNEALQARMENNTSLMRALQQLERDISWRTTVELASPEEEEKTATLEDGSESAAPASGSRNPSTVSLLPVGISVQRTAQSPLSFELVRAAPAAPGHWQHVQWQLIGDTLYRAAGEAGAAYPLPAPQHRIAVLTGISTFDIRAWEPGQGWKRLPAPARAQAGATGLEIVLVMRENHGPGARYRRVIALG